MKTLKIAFAMALAISAPASAAVVVYCTNCAPVELTFCQRHPIICIFHPNKAHFF